MSALLDLAKLDIKRMRKAFDRLNADKTTLAQKLQPFVDFDIYVSIFEGDGVCVMHGGKNVGMAVSMFIRLSKEARISESEFLNQSNY